MAVTRKLLKIPGQPALLSALVRAGKEGHRAVFLYVDRHFWGVLPSNRLLDCGPRADAVCSGIYPVGPEYSENDLREMVGYILRSVQLKADGQSGVTS